MKAQSVLVALLVSGCMTEPAYIGEGPATDTGGSGGSSGTGGGMENGGSGVPVQGGGGGAPGAGSSLPLDSGSCWISEHHPLAPEFDKTTLVTWDGESRTFGIGHLYLRFDRKGFLVERWDDGGWRDFIEYDARGTPTSYTYWFNDGVDPRESWDQGNDYDESGRLASTILNYRANEGFPVRQEATSFGIVDDGPPPYFMRTSVAAETRRTWYDLSYEGGRPIFLEAALGGGAIIDRREAWYDADGRLIQTEWDSGVAGVSGIDGEVDSREHWFYDEAGRIIRYEADFESGGEYASSVDGVPDEIYEFEPACAEIAVAPYYLYGIPSWLFPYARTGGWRF